MNHEEALKELLLRDYEYFADSFWKNEQTGETRVNMFIGLVTLVVGLISALATTADPPDDHIVKPIASGLLFALAALGQLTLLRIMQRNKVTDQWKDRMDMVRRCFIKTFDDDKKFKKYDPFPESVDRKPSKRKLGGLSHIVAAINSMLIGAAVSILIPQECLYCGPLAIGAGVSLLIFFIEYAFINK